jgi:superfamily II DNA helicase RecQ
MQIKLFTIPIADDGNAILEFNKFLASHKVLETEQHFFQNEKGAVWCFCVRYLGNAANGFTGAASNIKIDYKTVLSEAEFSVFSRLREIRKEIAMADAVPAYAVFIDEELANICRLSEISATQIQTIKGIATKRMEKYGNVLVAKYIETVNNHETK